MSNSKATNLLRTRNAQKFRFLVAQWKFAAEILLALRSSLLPKALRIAVLRTTPPPSWDTFEAPRFSLSFLVILLIDAPFANILQSAGQFFVEKETTNC